MVNVNFATVEGNLTKDPQIRMTQTGKKVASFTVASTQGDQQSQITAFVPVVAWNYEAEAAETLKKGDRVLVAGRINTRSYVDQNGEKKYVWEIVTRIVAKRPQTGTQQQNTDGYGARNQTAANGDGAVDWAGRFGNTYGSNAQQEDIPF